LFFPLAWRFIFFADILEVSSVFLLPGSFRPTFRQGESAFFWEALRRLTMSFNCLPLFLFSVVLLFSFR